MTLHLRFGQGKAFLALSLMAFLVACSSEIEQALPAASESGGGRLLSRFAMLMVSIG